MKLIRNNLEALESEFLRKLGITILATCSMGFELCIFVINVRSDALKYKVAEQLRTELCVDRRFLAKPTIV